MPIAVYIPATRSINGHSIDPFAGVACSHERGGGYVDIEVARGWGNMRDSCSLQASANTEQL